MTPFTLSPFVIGALPRVIFGRGSIRDLPTLVREFGTCALLVTGARSFVDGPYWPVLTAQLRAAGIAIHRATVSGEPSPSAVDAAVTNFREAAIDVVVGIGGGSVLDAAKAIAGLLPHGNSVMDHLEGVGAQRPYAGPATPFIAVPTTAGTGSEATKNAVLSMPGRDGFKKSFRHDALVARYALVDPDLLSTCPPALIAANGMDALTQLIESYVSSRANAVSDALAVSGIVAAREGLLPWFELTRDADAARERMAYAALISGITLAQVGLGSVHGLASPLGAFFPIPHGVVCGTLVATATAENIRALNARAPTHPALDKYAHVAELLTGKRFASRDLAWRGLVAILEEWTQCMQLPRLGAFGVGADDVAQVVAGARGSSMKTNPIVLTDTEIARIVHARL